MSADMDYDFSLDEPEIEQPDVDEDAHYLLDEQETEDEAKAKAEREEEERLQALVDKKVANYFTKPDPTPTRRPEPQPSSASITSGMSEQEIIDKMAEDITNDLALDPKAAVRKVLQATRAMSVQAGETATERANRVAIEQYRASRRSDPMFQAVAEDFEAEVATYTPRQLATSTPDQVRRALEAAEDQALGRHYKRLLTEKRTRQAAPPPAMGGRGSSGGGRVSTETRLTADDKLLIKMAKSSGLSEKDIRELVRENRKK
jgi:hypothetical protein